MHTLRVSTLLVAFLLVAPSQAAIFGRAFSIEEYKAELDRLSTLAGRAADDPTAADTAISELRGDWRVESSGQTFDVRTGALIDEFERAKDSGGREVVNDLQNQLKALRADAEEFEQTPPDPESTRSALNRILERREFHQVRGPSWFDRLKYRIIEWIFRLLSRFFGSSSAPIVGRTLVWTIVAVAVIVVAFLVLRAIRETARFQSVVPQVVPVSAKGWHVWMREAQAAAAAGLWREAVHLAYWAGISFLEQSGMWKPDQARTPREYLRLLPAESSHRPTLSTLTRRLEETWYGNRQAEPETFSEVSKLLENLGCRQA